MYGRLRQMEVNVGDHSNRLIDVEEDIDRLQSDSKTGHEFLGQKLLKLGDIVQSNREDIQSTQSRVHNLEDTMTATTDTLRGLTETNERIQRGWDSILDRLENLPTSITNAVDTWASINMRSNEAATRVVTGAQLHGRTTSTWFGDIRTSSQLTDRHTPPPPVPTQQTTSTDPSPDKFFKEYCRQSEDGHDVFQDVVMTQESAQEHDNVSAEGREVSVDDTSRQEMLAPRMGQSDERNTEPLVDPIGMVTTSDANIAHSTSGPMEAIVTTVDTTTVAATNVDAGEMSQEERSSTAFVPTTALVARNPSISSSTSSTPPIPISPNVIPPTPTSSVHVLQSDHPAEDALHHSSDIGHLTASSLDVPRRSPRWPSPSSASPPLTRSRSRSRTPLPPFNYK